MAGSQERVRVGFFPTTGPVGETGDAAAYLARAHDAGIDHVCCGDHVSFFIGVGLDGLLQATALTMLHPTLPVMTGVYLLPLRHPVSSPGNCPTSTSSRPGVSCSASASAAKTATRWRSAASTRAREGDAWRRV